MMESASPDRRKHKRYTVPDDAISTCNRKVGRIINISEGGMAVNFIFDEPFSEENNVSILSRTDNLFIKDIPVKLVHKMDGQHSFTGTFQLQTVGARFNYLDGAQQEQIKEYIFQLSRHP